MLKLDSPSARPFFVTLALLALSTILFSGISFAQTPVSTGRELARGTSLLFWKQLAVTATNANRRHGHPCA